VAGFASKSGAVSAPFTFAASTSGTRTTSSNTESNWVFSATSAGAATKAGATSSTYVFSATTAGAKVVVGASSSTWVFAATTAGDIFAGWFGETSLAITFSATTAGYIQLGPGPTGTVAAGAEGSIRHARTGGLARAHGRLARPSSGRVAVGQSGGIDF